jgi:hypothetical protein
MSQNVWATIMPFGPVTNFLLAQKKNFGPAKAVFSFRICVNIHYIFNTKLTCPVNGFSLFVTTF